MRKKFTIYRQKPDGSRQKRTFKTNEKALRVLESWVRRGVAFRGVWA